MSFVDQDVDEGNGQAIDKGVAGLDVWHKGE